MLGRDADIRKLHADILAWLCAVRDIGKKTLRVGVGVGRGTGVVWVDRGEVTVTFVNSMLMYSPGYALCGRRKDKISEW